MKSFMLWGVNNKVERLEVGTLFKEASSPGDRVQVISPGMH